MVKFYLLFLHFSHIFYEFLFFTLEKFIVNHRKIKKNIEILRKLEKYHKKFKLIIEKESHFLYIEKLRKI